MINQDIEKEILDGFSIWKVEHRATGTERHFPNIFKKCAVIHPIHHKYHYVIAADKWEAIAYWRRINHYVAGDGDNLSRYFSGMYTIDEDELIATKVSIFNMTRNDFKKMSYNDKLHISKKVDELYSDTHNVLNLLTNVSELLK